MTAPADPNWEREYRHAQQLFDEGRFNEAEQIFIKLLETNPKGYADICNRLGQIATQKGLFERAVEYFEQALKINPRYTDASLNLAVTLNELQKFDEAEKVFSRAAKIILKERDSLDPYIQGKLANEHAKLGDSYYELGRFDHALEEYRKALNLKPNFADIHTKIGITLRDRGDLEQAIHAFEKAKVVNPDYAAAFINEGLVYYTLGEMEMAEKEWNAAKKLDPSNRAVDVYLKLARRT
ncbi:MAG TPA: tetratricopeptide repeat protein [Nitrospiria bacterium]